MPGARITVVGSLNADLVVRAPRLPRVGETILGGPFATYPGGKGANQAIAAARLGAAVTMIGCVGDDAHGAMMIRVLRDEGIHLADLITREGEATGVGVITVDDSGENTIVVASGANATLTARDVDDRREAIAGADALLMQLETTLEAVERAASVAVEAGVPVYLNAAPARPLPASLLKSLHALIVNRGEARLLAEAEAEDDPAGLARRLHELGAATVIVTLGERGALLFDGPHAMEQGALPVNAVDATAAGDAFSAALVVESARRADPRAALRTACAAGALAVTRAGAVPSLPTAAELAEFLDRHA